MTQRPSTEAELDALAGRVEAWLEVQRTENPVVAAVERDEESGERRWFVRLRGDAKDVFTIWFHLDQRTLHYETYVMPAPEENAGGSTSTCCARTPSCTGPRSASGSRTPCS